MYVTPHHDTRFGAKSVVDPKLVLEVKVSLVTLIQVKPFIMKSKKTNKDPLAVYNEHQRKSIADTVAALELCSQDPKFPVPLAALQACEVNDSVEYALGELLSLGVIETDNSCWKATHIPKNWASTAADDAAKLRLIEWVSKTFPSIFDLDDWTSDSKSCWLVASGLKLVVGSKEHWHHAMANWVCDYTVFTWLDKHSSRVWDIADKLTEQACNVDSPSESTMLEVAMITRAWLRECPLNEELARLLPEGDGHFKRMVQEGPLRTRRKEFNELRDDALWFSCGLHELNAEPHVVTCRLSTGRIVMLTTANTASHQPRTALLGDPNDLLSINNFDMEDFPVQVTRWMQFPKDWVGGLVHDKPDFLLFHPASSALKVIRGDLVCSVPPWFHILQDETFVVVTLRLVRMREWALEVTKPVSDPPVTETVPVTEDFAKAAIKIGRIKLLTGQGSSLVASAGEKARVIIPTTSPPRRGVSFLKFGDRSVVSHEPKEEEDAVGRILAHESDGLVWAKSGSSLLLCRRTELLEARKRIDIGLKVVEARRDLGNSGDDPMDRLVAGATADHVDTVREILEGDTSIEEIFSKLDPEHNPVWEAAYVGSLDVLNLLCSKLPGDLLRRSIEMVCYKKSALVAAASKGHHHAIPLLFKYEQPSVGRLKAALNWACKRGHLEAAKELLEAESASLLTPGSKDALIVRAIKARCPDIVSLLIEEFEYDTETMSKKPFLVDAVDVKSLELVQLLIEAGADPDAKNDTWENTPLHIACEQGLVEITNALVPVSNSLLVENLNHKTPFQLACGTSNPDLIRAFMPPE